MKRFLIFLTFVGVFAGTAVYYDPNSAGITNRITNIRFSMPPETANGSNIVVFNTWNDIYTNNFNNLKLSNNIVVLLSTADQTAISNATVSANIASTQLSERRTKTNALASVNQLDQNGRLIRALAKVTMDEINILRAQHGLTSRTLTQLTNAITAELNAQPDNN
jgi:hypothetical protein